VTPNVLNSGNGGVKSRAELRRCPLSRVLLTGSGLPKLGRLCLRLALKLEGGGFYSDTARRIMERRYGVRIGAYSYGSCFVPGVFPSGAVVGRYVSTAEGLRIFRRNHPVSWLSTHPFFFNQQLGYVLQDLVPFRPLAIEHDAWIGDSVIITPGCLRIGIGAVVGAGSVVTKDVPDFAVVAGNPAAIIKFRFPEAVRQRVLAGRWWERSVEQCAQWLGAMTSDLGEEATQHPLLAPAGLPSA
jgi:acetyltransferase-like isoleucine patch superfamily enzyme